MSKDLHRRARRQGLRYVEADALTITRHRCGRGFTYKDEAGRTVRDPEVGARIKTLAVPPAWTEVHIAHDARAHIQAIGRDADGRLQYRYHDDWKEVRDQIKAERLVRFGRALPRIRSRLRRDLGRDQPDLRFAAAAATRLIDRALLRAGHDSVAAEEANGGRGATTLLKRDVHLNGSEIALAFTGKGGKPVRTSVRDPALLIRLKTLKKLGRKWLFVYRAGRGKRRHLTARELNCYLQEAAGEAITAKDFRTFAASSRALGELARAEPPPSKTGRKRTLAATMRATSETLNNTPAVARSSYVHPSIVEAFEAGLLDPAVLRGPQRRGLSAEETALMRFLENKRRPPTR
jgi:DNA topoisomerase-1